MSDAPRPSGSEPQSDPEGPVDAAPPPDPEAPADAAPATDPEAPADAAPEEPEPPEAQVSSATPPPDPAAPADASAPEEPEIGSEQIEWQPVVTGEHVEWQPVVTSEDQAWEDLEGPPAEPGSDEIYAYSSYGPEYDYPPEAEQPAEAAQETSWDSAASDVPLTGTSAIAGNGAPGGPGAAGAPPRSPVDEAIDARRAKTRRQVVLLSVLTAVVVVIGLAGFLLSRGATDKDDVAVPTPSSTLATLAPSQLQEFRDEETGFSIKFAKTWQRLRPPVADVRLVVDAGGNDGFRIRVAPIDTPATTQNIGNFKAVTDAVVLGEPTARLLQQQLVTLNGKLTYYYVYTFQDKETGQQGVHAHYFIFEGHRMFMLVFQSIPAEDFARQAGLFDQVAESLVIEPRPAPTTTAPTTTTATTTPP